MLSERQIKWLRVAAVIALVVVTLIIGRASGLADDLSRDGLRAAVNNAGGWGVPVFIGAFCLAVLVHLPAAGILFVAVAVAVYGRVPGGLLALAGAVIAVLVSFTVVRAIGGRPLAQVKNRFARRILEKLEAQPVLTVLVLRLIFFVGSPVNYALALSAVRPRDYVLGSVAGLIPPATVLTALFDLLVF